MELKTIKQAIPWTIFKYGIEKNNESNYVIITFQAVVMRNHINLHVWKRN